MLRIAKLLPFGALAVILTLAVSIDAFSQDKSKALTEKIVNEQALPRGEYFAAEQKRAEALEKRLDAFDKALSKLGERLDKIDGRLDGIEKAVKH